jgi:hypothetical protein
MGIIKIQRLKCIDNQNYKFLTVGKVYVMLEELDIYYTVICDFGTEATMSKVRFEKVD